MKIVIKQWAGARRNEKFVEIDSGWELNWHELSFVNWLGGLQKNSDMTVTLDMTSWTSQIISSLQQTMFHFILRFNIQILHNLIFFLSYFNCQALIQRTLFFPRRLCNTVRHKTNFKQLFKQCCKAKRSKLSFVQSEFFFWIFFFPKNHQKKMVNICRQWMNQLMMVIIMRILIAMKWKFK